MPKFLGDGIYQIVSDDMQIIKMVKKYDENRNVKPQEPDALTSDKHGLQGYLNTSEMLLRMTLYIRR